MDETFRIGRIAGIPVGANWSLLVVFWLIAWSLAAGEFPDAHPGRSDTAYWVAGVFTALVFFGSLLAHELSHALVARRRGMAVEGITLWLFGGVARLGGEASTARVELQVALVGPLVSLAAAAAFGVAALLADGLGASALVVAVPAWLARINLVLALFNLVPAYPLDGGRVLRAVLWARHGDRLRATATAARAGTAFAYVLIGVGLLDFAGGGRLGGLWFVFLGWFLLLASRAEEAGVLLRESLRGVRVRDLMSPDPVVAPAGITAEELLEDYALRHRCSAFPLVDEGGALVGLVTLGRLKQVPPARRHASAVRDLACPIADVPVAHPDDPVVDLLERLAGSPDGRALVLDDGGALVGIVTPTDVARMTQLAALRRGGTGGRGVPPDGR